MSHRASVVVIAPDFGDDRSAATSRYRSLAAAAASLGVTVQFLNSRGLGSESTYRLDIDAPRDNQRGFVRRALHELWAGLRMSATVPSATVSIVGIPQIFTGLVIASILRLRRRRYWVDVRDIYPDVFVAAGICSEHSLFARAVSLWTKWIYDGSEGVIAATASIQQKLKSRTTSEVHLVRNGYGSRFSLQPAPNLDSPLIATHGTLGRFQNVALLADLIREARRQKLSWRFLVVGDGPCSGPLAALTADNLLWIRAATQDKMPELLGEAALGLSLRTTDDISAGSIPVRILEYLGLGIPVLVHPYSEGATAVQISGAGVCVNDADAAAIVDSIRHLLEPDAYATARRAVETTRGQFSGMQPWEMILPRIAGLVRT